MRDEGVLSKNDKTPLVKFSLVEKNLTRACQKLISKIDVYENWHTAKIFLQTLLSILVISGDHPGLY